MKRYVIIGLLIVALIASVLVVFLSVKKQSGQSQEKVTLSSLSNENEEDLETWTDPAGFTFQYPKDITINTHDEDTDNYAHLELTQSDHPGSTIVWAKDTTYADVAEWVSQDTVVKNGISVDSTLGGVSAKKIIQTTPKKMFVIGAITDDILFSVESTPGQDTYWQNVFDTISRSFQFTDENGTPASASKDESESASEDTVIDIEEVVE